MAHKSLPGKLIVKTGKFIWTSMWQIMMSQIAPRDQEGDYLRPESQFRQRVGVEPAFPAATQRYRLFVGMGCPWAHRTLVTRALKGLEDAIAVSVVDPSPDAGIWLLSETEFGCQTVPELYQLAQPGYRGRCTVPIIWDDQHQKIINNESAEIIEMLNSEFNQFAQHPEQDLYPEKLRASVNHWNELIYRTVNNGVYRCGFAQTQTVYEQACQELFSTLDQVDTALAENQFLCGNQLTLADVRLFTTLFRFDLVYFGLFKCNLRRIADYPHISRYLKTIYQLPGVAQTCDAATIKRDYYGNLFPLNPGGIIPLGPDLQYLSD